MTLELGLAGEGKVLEDTGVPLRDVGVVDLTLELGLAREGKVLEEVLEDTVVPLRDLAGVDATLELGLAGEGEVLEDTGVVVMGLVVVVVVMVAMGVCDTCRSLAGEDLPDFLGDLRWW